MLKQELDGQSIFTVSDFFSPSECEELIARTEHNGFEDAPITTPYGFKMRKDVRNNARVMFDDTQLADQLWQRARPFLPARFGSWEAIALNERFRAYRYGVGERFAPHYDGTFQRSAEEKSKLTFMIYLNDGFEGGETNFYLAMGQLRTSVLPERGKALVFIHDQVHEGAAIVRGVKYVLRTDVMYRRPY